MNITESVTAKTDRNRRWLHAQQISLALSFIHGNIYSLHFLAKQPNTKTNQ